MGEIKCYTCKFVNAWNNSFCQTCYQNGEAMNYMPKEDDQTAKKDGGKLRMTLVPWEIVRAIAKVRMFGLLKYTDEHNWKRVEKRRYKDALVRHLLAYLEDEKAVDEESGLPALYHVATNVAFLIELEKKDGTFKS